MSYLQIGETLKHWRVEVLKLTGEEFGKLVGQSKGAISKYENNRLHMSLDLLEAWAAKINSKKYKVSDILICFLTKRYPILRKRFFGARKR